MQFKPVHHWEGSPRVSIYCQLPATFKFLQPEHGSEDRRGKLVFVDVFQELKLKNPLIGPESPGILVAGDGESMRPHETKYPKKD